MQNDLRKLLATLILHKSNFQIIHWKVKGSGWDEAHNTTQKYYEELEKQIDEIGEICLQLEIEPVSIKEALELLNSSSDKVLEMKGSDTVSVEEAWILSKAILSQLSEICTRIQNSDLLDEFKSIIENYQVFYKKEIHYKLLKRIG